MVQDTTGRLRTRPGTYKIVLSRLPWLSLSAVGWIGWNSLMTMEDLVFSFYLGPGGPRDALGQGLSRLSRTIKSLHCPGRVVVTITASRHPLEGRHHKFNVVETFNGLVHEAGFGSFGNRQVQIGLPEPHAVAVFELCDGEGQVPRGDGAPLKESKPVLFVDAGGGTAVRRPGHNIGSAYIDQSFQSSSKAVFAVSSILSGPPRSQNGVLRTHRCDLEPLFDAQVQKLIYNIHHVTNSVNVDEEIRVHRLREHLYKDEDRRIKLHISASPRLAVCHGLVEHALRGPMFQSHCSRVSFGLVCRVRKPRRLGTTFQTVLTNMKRESRGNENIARPEDGSFFDRWGAVLTQAKKKGRDKAQVVHTDKPVTRKFSTFFPQDLPTSDHICYVSIVTSTQSTPSEFGDGVDVGTHTFLKVDLSSIPMYEIEEKNMDLLSQAIGKKPHVKDDFLIEATFDLADADVQCSLTSSAVRYQDAQMPRSRASHASGRFSRRSSASGRPRGRETPGTIESPRTRSTGDPGSTRNWGAEIRVIAVKWDSTAREPRKVIEKRHMHVD
ncbi:hypothetical protein B0J13DRAFT_607247 [Dactylonectria estremocensis]|uniref:Uncharacterized protein n=1 Tax=Dactylonectria estremocensis TaxID=1079267 RepID=A0A9P9EVZ4_9HYPO|nr:hypothetical protein B0J13DRAFT_607247 [Dactylonectria estremocensis]